MKNILVVALIISIGLIGLGLYRSGVNVIKPNAIEQFTNEARVKNGLKPLKVDVELRNSACARVDDMIKNNYWEHTSPAGVPFGVSISRAGYNYSRAGENIAIHFDTARGTVDRWLKSPEHNKNIMGDYKDTGVCSKAGMIMGKDQTVTVQHFGKRNIFNIR